MSIAVLVFSWSFSSCPTISRAIFARLWAGSSGPRGSRNVFFSEPHRQTWRALPVHLFPANLYLLKRGDFKVKGRKYKRSADIYALYLPFTHSSSFILQCTGSQEMMILIEESIIMTFSHRNPDSCPFSMGVFIGPESDHWQCLSLTDSLTP